MTGFTSAWNGNEPHRDVSANPTARLNNFDLIRLLAAFQVVFVHAVGHTPVLESGPPWLRPLLDVVVLFPGVAVFFVLSGFLIARSWERLSDEPKTYLWHRALRIYPALLVCFAITLVVLGVSGFLTPETVGSPEFWVWLAGQLTCGQFYNPGFFRGFGTGVVNGALWTISVELQFYLLLPLFYKFVFRRAEGPGGLRWITGAAFVLSFAAFWYVDASTNRAGGFTAAPMAAKLLFISLVPHAWMFLLGILIHRHFGVLSRWLEGRFMACLGAYSVVAVARQMVLGRDGGMAAVYYLGYLPERVLLALMTIAAAYSVRGLSSRLLRGNDISYGVYIYHFVIINVLMQLGWMRDLSSVLAVFVLTALMGLLSWHGIEKRALSLKGLVGAPLGGVCPKG